MTFYGYCQLPFTDTNHGDDVYFKKISVQFHCERTIPEEFSRSEQMFTV